MSRASKRELLLDTAETLFVQHGFMATGINRIREEADVAGMTLYNNFKGKDDLVLAVLVRIHQEMIEEIEEVLEAMGGPPGERVLAVFDYLLEYAEDESFRHESDGSFVGCIFNHAASEYRAFSHPIHQATTKHKQKLVGIFEGLAKEMKHPRPEALGQTLGLLVDGAFTSAQILDDMNPFKQARNAAQILLEH